jgi:hypothetical protein
MSLNSAQSEVRHPSFLALDRVHLGDATAEVTAHVAECPHCRGYLDTLSSTTVPNFTTLQTRLAVQRRAQVSWWWGSSAAALAAAACFLLILQNRQPPAVATDGPAPANDLRTTPNDTTYLGSKGFRSVWVYVKHGAETRLWDGKQPVVAGDQVRLKLDPGAYHRVEVYSLSDPTAPSLLFAGALTPGQILTLPEAWEIDDSSTAEQLYVVFSDAPARPDWSEWRAGRVPADIAVLPISLTKVSP